MSDLQVTREGDRLTITRSGASYFRMATGWIALLAALAVSLVIHLPAVNGGMTFQKDAALLLSLLAIQIAGILFAASKLRPALRKAKAGGDEIVFDRQADRFQMNGQNISLAGEICRVEVSEIIIGGYEPPQYPVTAVLKDGREVRIEQMSSWEEGENLARQIAEHLGVSGGRKGAA